MLHAIQEDEDQKEQSPGDGLSNINSIPDASSAFDVRSPSFAAQEQIEEEDLPCGAVSQSQPLILMVADTAI